MYENEIMEKESFQEPVVQSKEETVETPINRFLVEEKQEQGTAHAQLQDTLQTEEEVQLTQEEEAELQKYMDKHQPPTFPPMSESKTKFMQKFMKGRYARYTQQKEAAIQTYRNRQAAKRSSYLRLARARRQARQAGNENIGLNLSDEEKVAQMKTRIYGTQEQTEMTGLATMFKDFATETEDAAAVKDYTGSGYRRVNLYYRERAKILKERPECTGEELDREIMLRMEQEFSNADQRAYRAYKKSNQPPDQSKPFKQWYEKIKQEADNMKSLINLIELPKDIVLTRQIGIGALTGMGLPVTFNATGEQYDRALAEYAQRGTHDIIREDGVGSTSYGPNEYGGTVELVILAHKGTHAAPVNLLSKYSEENEVLLAPGQAFKVLKTEEPGGGRRNVADLCRDDHRR